MKNSLKAKALISLYSYSKHPDEEVTFDSLLGSVADMVEVDNDYDTEVLLRDFLVFSGEDKPTLDSATDDTIGELIKEFGDSFDTDDEFLTTMDSFLDEVTADKVCDARHEKHITYHADGGKTVGCKLKKGAVRKTRTPKQKLADARRRNHRLSKATKLKRSRAMKRRS